MLVHCFSNSPTWTVQPCFKTYPEAIFHDSCETIHPAWGPYDSAETTYNVYHVHLQIHTRILHIYIYIYIYIYMGQWSCVTHPEILGEELRRGPVRMSRCPFGSSWLILPLLVSPPPKTYGWTYYQMTGHIYIYIIIIIMCIYIYIFIIIIIIIIVK